MTSVPQRELRTPGPGLALRDAAFGPLSELRMSSRVPPRPHFRVDPRTN